VKDIEENVMNVNCLHEVPFLEEAIYNMSMEKMIKEYENIKKWFMFNKMANHFQVLDLVILVKLQGKLYLILAWLDILKV